MQPNKELLITTTFRITQKELEQFKQACPEGKYGITLRGLIKKYIADNNK